MTPQSIDQWLFLLGIKFSCLKYNHDWNKNPSRTITHLTYSRVMRLGGQVGEYISEFRTGGIEGLLLEKLVMKNYGDKHGKNKAYWPIVGSQFYSY